MFKICFDNFTESANQIAGFCQIIETDHVFEEIYVKFRLYPPMRTILEYLPGRAQPEVSSNQLCQLPHQYPFHYQLSKQVYQ